MYPNLAHDPTNQQSNSEQQQPNIKILLHIAVCLHTTKEFATLIYIYIYFLSEREIYCSSAEGERKATCTTRHVWHWSNVCLCALECVELNKYFRRLDLIWLSSANIIRRKVGISNFIEGINCLYARKVTGKMPLVMSSLTVQAERGESAWLSTERQHECGKVDSGWPGVKVTLTTPYITLGIMDYRFLLRHGRSCPPYQHLMM